MTEDGPGTFQAGPGEMPAVLVQLSPLNPYEYELQHRVATCSLGSCICSGVLGGLLVLRSRRIRPVREGWSTNDCAVTI